ncbi:MAG: DUF483 domain-containing protein [Deltaproteobacteria bacterium]|nr:MAG: DUF483 domain-containing protein [Deltaproteobacteria bacterium]
MRPAERGRWKGNPVILFERQFRALVDTVPDAKLPLAVRVVGEQAMLHIEAIANRTLKIAPFEVELLLDCRPDMLLKWERRLRRALGRLRRASSGHRIELCLLGVENFSSRELEIYNKGLTPSDNLRAIGLLHKLENQYPGHFGFRRYGGLSMITYNPWTRPRDLALNLAVVQMLGLGNLCGKLLGGRLRLYPKLPLYLKARMQGLLIGHYGDPLMNTASRNMYVREVPWQFNDARMEAICSKLVRLDDEEKNGSEKVSRALEILDTGLANGKREIRRRNHLPHGSQGQYDEDTLHRIVASCQVKPVCLVEPLGREEAEQLGKSGLLPNPVVRRKGTEPNSLELFCGRRRKDVVRAANLAEQIEKAPLSRLKGLIRKMGRLLGYPDCCCSAFSSLHPRFIDDNFFLRVLRRIESPGRVSWRFNPGGNPLLEYLPCSLECERSLSRFEHMARAWKHHAGLDMEALRKSLSHPTLIFKQMQDCFVELIPHKVREDHGGAFFLKYSVGQHSGQSRLLEGVLRGDALVVEPECMAVLRRGREIAALSGRAYLWWHERAFQVEFWRALIDTVRVGMEGDHRTSHHAVQKLDDTDALKLARQLEKLGFSRCDYNGYAMERVTTLGGGRVRVVFSKGTESFALELERAASGKPFYLRAAGLVMTYPNSMPIRSEEQKVAAYSFAESLRRLQKRSVSGDGEAKADEQ